MGLVLVSALAAPLGRAVIGHAAEDGNAAPGAPQAHAGHVHAGHQHGAAADMAAPLPFGLVGDAATGQALYRANCLSCHGPSGDGAGPLAASMKPRPASFTSPAARATLARPHLFDAIGKGVDGSGMPAWQNVLTPQQIADLAEYVFVSFVRAVPAKAE